MTVAWQGDSTWTSPNVKQELSKSFQGGNDPLVVRQFKFTMLLIGHRDRQDSGTDGVTYCMLVVTDVHTYMYVVWNNEPSMCVLCC